MDVRRIRELRLADPFKPFALVMDDGRRLPVEKPYYLGIAPGDAFLVHSSLDDWFERIHPNRVRDVEFLPAAGVGPAAPAAPSGGT